MPNWCSNSITTNNPAIIAAAEKSTGDEGRFLGELFPRPEALDGIHSGGCTDILGNKVKLWRDTPEGSLGLTPAEEAELIANYGAANWYDWSVQNYGTKWDTSVRRILPAENEEEGYVIILFDTAWSPPEAWLQHVMDEHPEGRTVLAYAEGGSCFFGLVEYEDGELYEQWTSENFWSDERDEDDWALPTKRCQRHLDRYLLHTGG